jgi:dienelactone hydrolase
MGGSKRQPGRRLVWGMAAGALGLTSLGLMLVAVAGVPVSRGPQPASALLTAPPDPGAHGPYAVGVTHRSVTRPSTATGEPRTADTPIWYPATAAAVLPRDERLGAAVDAPPERAGRLFPVLLYSPGGGGGLASGVYLKTHLASHGFVVVGLTHPGTSRAPCPFQPCMGTNPEARAWLAEAAANRPDDVRFTLDAVLGWSAGGDPHLGGLIDAERIGLVGASWGGSTMIEVAGDGSRVRALVSLAAAGPPAAQEAALATVPRLAMPTLLVAGGEWDHLAPVAQQQGLFAAFAASAPEVWFVTLPRAGHSMLQSFCPDGYPECGSDGLPRPEALPLPEAHARTNRWMTAFLGRHLAGESRYAPLLDPALADGDPDIRVTVARASGPGGDAP